MVRLIAFSVLGLVVALASVAARCGDTDTKSDFPLSFEGPSCVERETVPTAIPTEEWTPEWLSGWSDILKAASRRQSDESARRLAAGNVSMADVERVESIVDVFTVPSLEETLREAEQIAAGRVVRQKLETAHEDARQTSYLLSQLDADGLTFTVAQRTNVVCFEDEMALDHLVNEPLLEAGVTYVLLLDDSKSVGGAPRVLPQIFRVEGGGLNNLSLGDDVASIEELLQLHEAAR